MSKFSATTGDVTVDKIRVELPLFQAFEVTHRPWPIATIGCHPGLTVHFLLKFVTPEQIREKDLLISYQLIGPNGPMLGGILAKPRSARQDIGYYEYVQPGPADRIRQFSVTPPDGCRQISISLWPWRQKDGFALENVIVSSATTAPRLSDSEAQELFEKSIGFGAAADTRSVRITSSVGIARGPSGAFDPGDSSVVQELAELRALIKQGTDQLAEMRAKLEQPGNELGEARAALEQTMGELASSRARQEALIEQINSINAVLASDVAPLLNAYANSVSRGVAHHLPVGDPFVSLTKSPIIAQIWINPGDRYSVVFEFDPNERLTDSREALVALLFHDASGALIEPPYKGIKTSSLVGPYSYLSPVKDNPNQATASFDAPANAAHARLAIQAFEPRGSLSVSWTFHVVNLAERQRARKANSLLTSRLEQQSLSERTTSDDSFIKGKKPASTVLTPAAPLRGTADAQRRPRETRVAMICDEFSYNSFKYECTPISVEPNNWRALFEEHQPELFFCESAWSGADSRRRPWKGGIYSSINFKSENRTPLLEILKYCQQRGIPTVFWNKEDPSHYTDRVHDFVKTAQLFDTVLTTAEECVPLYKAEYGCERVACLPFATQPKLFNPVETYERTRNVVFAGSWYKYHAERSADMETMFEAIIDAGFGLEIYDRYHGDTDPNHIFPEKYRKFTKPSVPHDQIDAVYKSSLFGLNVNTVKDSPSMFARRVFELMSSNTLVLSNYSSGVDSLFGDVVLFADRKPFALSELSRGEIDQLRDEALHRVLSHHTYRNRFSFILNQAGIAHRAEQDSVTLIAVVRTRDDAQAACRTYDKQREGISDCRLLLIVAPEVPNIEVAQYYQEFNRFGVSVTSASYARQYAGSEYNPIETAYFAVLNPREQLADRAIARAVLHFQYIDNQVIQFGSEHKYRFAPPRGRNRLIAPAGLFTSLFSNLGEEFAAEVYHV